MSAEKEVPSSPMPTPGLVFLSFVGREKANLGMRALRSALRDGPMYVSHQHVSAQPALPT